METLTDGDEEQKSGGAEHGEIKRRERSKPDGE